MSSSISVAMLFIKSYLKTTPNGFSTTNQNIGGDARKAVKDYENTEALERARRKVNISLVGLIQNLL